MLVNISKDIDPNCRMIIFPLTSADLTNSTLAADLGISTSSLEGIFEGKRGETYYFKEEKQLFVLLGLGDNAQYHKLSRIFRAFSNKQQEKLDTTIGLYLKHIEAPSKFAKAAMNGFLLGTYQVGQFKTDTKKQHPLTDPAAQLQIFTEAAVDEITTATQFGLQLAATQIEIMQLVNAPSNHKTPQHLARWAVQSAGQHAYKATIWDKAQIEEAHLGGLLAVNRGSEHPAVFIILEYNSPAATQTIGLVGKGVTFDTGGLSIKGAKNMHYMKSDMGGAAAVLGTIEMAAKLQLPVNLVGIVPSTDNSVDALSIKPSDVIDTYSGKTIEIIDTDAEGRLILADGLSYMVKNFKPDVLIDLATLTGSAVRTFGYQAGAFFSNNDQLARALKSAGNRIGERVWRLPLFEEYFEDIQSDVADIKNLGAMPMAGAIIAAKFLEFFTDAHPNWAHFDIAGMAFSEAEFSKQKSATAFGIHLLIEYLMTLTENP